MSMSPVTTGSTPPQAPITTQIDYAVAKKALDAQKQQGDAAIQLLESAAQVAQEANAPTHGGSLDVTG